MPANNSTNYLPQIRSAISPCVPLPFSNETSFDYYYYNPQVKFKKYLIKDKNFRELIQQILRYFHQQNIIRIWVLIPAII